MKLHSSQTRRPITPRCHKHIHTYGRIARNNAFSMRSSGGRPYLCYWFTGPRGPIEDLCQLWALSPDPERSVTPETGTLSGQLLGRENTNDSSRGSKLPALPNFISLFMGGDAGLRPHTHTHYVTLTVCSIKMKILVSNKTEMTSLNVIIIEAVTCNVLFHEASQLIDP